MTVKYAVSDDASLPLNPKDQTVCKDIITARALAMARGYKKSRNILIYEVEFERGQSWMFSFKAQCIGHVMTNTDGSAKYIMSDSRAKRYETYELQPNGKLGRRL